MSRESILACIAAVNEIVDEIKPALNEYEQKPRSDSQASKELKEFAKSDFIGTAFSQGILLVEAAADYCFAATKSLSEPAEVFAPWVCVRGILEACALSMWLLDTKINPKERVSRSLAFRYEGLDQQKKLMQASQGKLGAKQIMERIDKLELIVIALGFAKVLDKNGKRMGIGQEMPYITNIVIKMLNKEVKYRLFSAVAHGHAWALMQVGLVTARQEQNVFENVKGSYLEKGFSLEIVKFLCIECIEDLSEAYLMNFELFGWDIQPIQTATTNALIKIKTSSFN